MPKQKKKPLYLNCLLFILLLIPGFSWSQITNPQVTATYHVGQVNESSETINVDPSNPFIQVNVCSGDSVKLEGNAMGAGPVNYSWIINSGSEVINNQMLFRLLPEDVILLSISDGISSLLVFVTINTIGSPPINVSIDSQGIFSICSASNSQMVDLIARAENPDGGSLGLGSGFTYEWFKDGLPLSGETDSVLSVSNDLSGAGNYSVIVTNVCGDSPTAFLSLGASSNPPNDPQIISENNSFVICDNDSLKLSVDINQTDSYFWFKNGVLFSEDPEVYANQVGTYKVVVSNGCGRDSTQIQIRDGELGVTSIQAFPNNAAICEGEEIELRILDDPSPVRYQWLKDGNLIFDFERDSLINASALPDIRITEGGLYQLLAVNRCDTSRSNSINIPSIAPPTVALIVPESSPSFCLPEIDSVRLSVQTDALSFNQDWFFSSDGSSYDSISNAAVLVARNTGFYVARVSNDCDSVFSDTLMVMVAGDFSTDEIKFTLQGTNPDCTGDVDLLADDFGADASYRWIKDGNAIATTQNNLFTISESGTYQVQAFNACDVSQVSDPQSIQIGVSPSNPMIFNANVMISQDQVNICTDTSTVIDLEARADGPELTYTWFRDGQSLDVGSNGRVNILEPGMYHFLVENFCGQTRSDTVFINFVSPPIPGEVILLADPCSDTTSTLLTVQSSATQSQYRWFFNGIQIATTDTTSLRVTQNGTYQVNVSNICVPGGVNSASINVEISKSLPVPNITSPNSANANTLCPGDSILLEAVLEFESPDISYRWFQGNQLVFTSNGPELWVSESGEYRVEVFSTIDFSCARLSAPFNVFVRPEPILLVTTQRSTTICRGDSLSLEAQSTIAPSEYRWFRNGSQISTASTITVLDSGTYRIEAIYETGNQAFPCPFVNSREIEVTVIETPAPTIFVDRGVLSTVNPNRIYADYQWNLNGVAVNDANDQIYLPIDSGQYSLTVVDFNGCIGFSDTLFHPGIYEEITEPIQISPNPNNGNFVVIVSTPREAEVSLSIVDAFGRLVQSQIVVPKNSSISGFGEWEVRDLATGIYLIRVLIGEKFVTRKVVVEN